MCESGLESADMTTPELVAPWVKSDGPSATNLADAGRRRLVRPRGAAAVEDDAEGFRAVLEFGRGMEAPPVRLAAVLLGGMRRNEGVRRKGGSGKERREQE